MTDKMPERIYVMPYAADTLGGHRDGTWSKGRSDYLSEQTVTKYIRADLVPRQAVTGDSWQVLMLIAQGYTVKVYDDRYVVVQNPEYEPDNGKDPNICFDIESISAHPRPAVSEEEKG